MQGSSESDLCVVTGGKNKWRLHPYFPIDVRLLSTALLGLGAYYFYFPPTSDQHQPNAGDGRVFGSPDSREPEPKQLEDPEGEPIPLDMATVAKHAQRLGQHSNSDPSSKEREQHQPYASDGRVLGSSESQEPTPGQDEHGEPLPFDESAAAKHAQRLQQRSKGEGGQEHQPNAGDGRVLGSAQSQEPEPQLRGDGEPLPFDDSAAAKHAKRLGQHAEQRQPNAGDGRVFGSSHSREPNPEQLDNGEDLPVDDGAVARHAQRLSQHSNQRESPDAEQHQPNAADGRVLGSEQSQEPKPKQQADGEPLPLDLDAVDKHQQRLEAATRQRAQEASQHQPRVGDGRKLGSADSVEPEPVELDNAEPHQPRVGDGRKMGSSDSKEPKPVAADSGEPMPLDQEAVARHQRRLEERVKQDQARHENAHDDEFAISGDMCLLAFRLCMSTTVNIWCLVSFPATTFPVLSMAQPHYANILCMHACMHISHHTVHASGCCIQHLTYACVYMYLLMTHCTSVSGKEVQSCTCDRWGRRQVIKQ